MTTFLIMYINRPEGEGERERERQREGGGVSVVRPKIFDIGHQCDISLTITSTDIQL
jgi:hypothetical protein